MEPNYFCLFYSLDVAIPSFLSIHFLAGEKYYRKQKKCFECQDTFLHFLYLKLRLASKRFWDSKIERIYGNYKMMAQTLVRLTAFVSLSLDYFNFDLY